MGLRKTPLPGLARIGLSGCPMLPHGAKQGGPGGPGLAPLSSGARRSGPNRGAAIAPSGLRLARPTSCPPDDRRLARPATCFRLLEAVLPAGRRTPLGPPTHAPGPARSVTWRRPCLRRVMACPSCYSLPPGLWITPGQAAAASPDHARRALHLGFCTLHFARCILFLAVLALLADLALRRSAAASAAPGRWVIRRDGPGPLARSDYRSGGGGGRRAVRDPDALAKKNVTPPTEPAGLGGRDVWRGSRVIGRSIQKS